MNIRQMLIVATIFLSAGAVQAGEITKAELKKALQDNPDVLIDAIKANKVVIFDIMSQTAMDEQARKQKEAQEAEKKAFEDSFNNPLKPAIDAHTRIRGKKDARYTLVEYSDFQCPFCARGFQRVEELRKKYGEDISFVFKNLPLSIHPMAMPAAQWLEAVSIQSPELAWKFHDALFSNQDKLGLDFFKATVKALGLDAARCEKDAGSQAVIDRISADMDEAKRFGFQGTPSFVLNGIPAKGAQPMEYFDEIIKKLNTAKAH